jgi:hypothetical protein
MARIVFGAAPRSAGLVPSVSAPLRSTDSSDLPALLLQVFAHTPPWLYVLSCAGCDWRFSAGAARFSALTLPAPAALDASFQAVRRFGHVVSCLGWGIHALAPLSFKEATYSGVFILPPLLSGEGRKHHREILDQARQLVESGQLSPVLDERRFTLNNMCDAYRTIRTGAARGKLVVDIAASNA